jgi:hypothetical protein
MLELIDEDLPEDVGILLCDPDQYVGMISRWRSDLRALI